MKISELKHAEHLRPEEVRAQVPRLFTRAVFAALMGPLMGLPSEALSPRERLVKGALLTRLTSESFVRLHEVYHALAEQSSAPDWKALALDELLPHEESLRAMFETPAGLNALARSLGPDLLQRYGQHVVPLTPAVWDALADYGERTFSWSVPVLPIPTRHEVITPSGAV